MTGTGIEPDDTGFVAVPTETLRPAAAGEGNDRTEAQGARETAGMVPRRRAQVAEPAAPPVVPVVTGKVSQTPSPGAVEYLLRNPGSAKAFDDVYHGGTVDITNPYAQFLKDPADDGVALQERLRLNRQKSYYTESVAGSTRLLLLSNAYKDPDPPDIDPERKRVNQEMRDEYVKVVADLEAAEHLKPWATSMEGLAALGGALEGVGLSPESWIGWGAKGASWMARTLKAGAQQSVIQGATDPLIQTMNIQADVQDHPEWKRTVGAMVAGFGIGAGGHLVGEGLGQIIGQHALRKQLVDLSHLDPAFQAPEHAAWTLDPANGIRFNLPERELSGIDREVQAAQQRRVEYGKAPEHSFDEAVAMEKEAARAADKEANKAKREAGEEVQAEQPGERDFDARTAAFHKETEGALDVAREHYGLDEDAVNDISKLYDRQPNEHPKEALERAMGKWIDQQEAEAIKIFADHDSELMRDWDEANRIQERYNQWADSQPFSYEEGNLGNFGKGLGEQRTLPGMTTRAGERIEHDVPFESGATHEGGRIPESGAQVPGERQGAPGRGEGAADGSRSGAERPAGGDAAGGAGRREGASEGLGSEGVARPANLPAAVPDKIFSGSGRTDNKGVYNGTDFPVAGPGRYFSFNEEHAKSFGPNVETASIGDITSNPLVIRGDDEWKALIKEAGWQVPNPFGSTPEQMAKMTADLQRIIKDKGHDGLVIWFNRAEQTDKDGAHWIKLLRNVFDEPQVIGFKERPKTERAAQGDAASAAEAFYKYDAELKEKFGRDYVGYRLATSDIDARNRDPKWFELREKMREAPKTEQTAQGEQTLMPGVEPITDRQRELAETAKGRTDKQLKWLIEDGQNKAAQMERAAVDAAHPADTQAHYAEQAKGLREGIEIWERELATREAPATAPPGGLFDQDARAQGDLLGREIPEDQQGLAKRRKGGKMEGEEGRPAEGIPHDAEKTLAIQSLQQQSMGLAEALNFPLREGRVQSRKAAGTFNTRSGVVRVREVPDFDVVSHEAGHAIEQKIGAPVTDLTKAHAVELRKLDYDQGPRGKRVNEGFAEYVRLMMTNPEYAQKNAPGFDAAFRDLMAREEPDILRKIEAAAQGYYDYHHASSVDAIESVVRSVHEEPGVIEKVKEAVSKDQLPLTINAVTQKIYDGIFDDKAPFTRMVRDLGRAVRERTGRPMDLLRAEDPEALWRLAEHSRQTATLDLQYGMRPYHEITPSGPALTDALAMALGEQSWWGKYNEGKRKDFSAYLVARQGEYLWRRHDAGEIPNPPVAFSAGDAVQAMKDLEALYPNFKDASDMVHIYTQEMLRKARDGHLITTDLFDKLMAREFYVPFMRDMSDKPMIGTGMGQGAEGPGTTQIVKRLRGSSRDIIDPLESIMSMTFLLERTLAHNDVALAMARLGEKAGSEGGKWVEQLPAHQAVAKTADLEQAIHNRAKEIGMPTEEADILIASLGGLEGDAVQGRYFEMERAAAAGEPILFYREGGELKAMRVISEKEGLPIYELMTQAPPLVTDLWANIISGAAALKRSSIITNPTFVLTNYIRDQMAAMLLRPDYVPFVGGLRGMADEWRQGNNAILYSYAGGVAGGRAVGVVDKAVERDINMLAHKGYAIDRIPTIKELMELASFTEAGTRNSIFGTVFEASKAKGLSDYEALIEAAFQARDILDFSRHGSRTMWLRRFLPFFNAHLQGLDKAKRVAIDPIVNRIRDGGAVFERDTAEFSNALMTITKTGAAGASLGAIYAAVMSSNDAYKDATPYLKGTHFIVPFGNKQFVVPKPFEMGLGFTAGEYAYHAMAEKDPRAARMFAEAAWDVVMPPNPISDFPVVTPAIELTLGKSLFTGRDIVPEQLQKLPSGQQATDRTSSLAKAVGTSAPAKTLGSMTKWLGDETGISPIKIDYAIGSQFATWGRDVMAMSQGVDQNAPAASLDDMVFFRRFVKDPTRSSDINMQFWKFMSQTTGKFNQDANGYRDLVKEATVRGQPLTQASEFLSKLPAAEKAFVTLKEGANDVGKPAFNADERRLHPLQHAYDAVEMLTGLRKELSTNTTTTFGERGKVTLDPEQRRLLLENVRELSQMEMRNALVIMGTPGYEGRMVLDPNDVMDKIKHISPVVASEIADRYAAGKVFSTDAIVKAWPQLRDDLVRNGTNAQIRILAYDAKAQGYQFNGQRVKRPGVARAPIAGTIPQQ